MLLWWVYSRGVIQDWITSGASRTLIEAIKTRLGESLAQRKDSMSDALNNIGVQIEVVASALAKAIKSTRKFGNAEQQAAIADIIKTGGPSLADNLARIGNVSQIRQELEKVGVLSSQSTALAQQVKNELAKIK